MVRFLIQFVDYGHRPILTKLSPNASCDTCDQESFQTITSFCKREAPRGYEIIGYTIRTGKDQCERFTAVNQHYMKEKFTTGMQVYEFYVNLSRRPQAQDPDTVPELLYEKKAEKAHTRAIHRVLTGNDAVHHTR